MPRGTPITTEQVDEMVKLYGVGMSSNDVGQQLGTDGRNVRRHLKRRGVLRSHKEAAKKALAQGKIRKHFFSQDFFSTWSQEMAWVLGLIYGDGNISVEEGQRYRLYICGSKEVIQKACKLIGYEGPWVNYNGAKGDWVAIQLYSKQIIQDLSNYGLYGGAKAASLRLPKIPKKYFGSFLRGYWDADGHWKVRGNNVVAKLTCASMEFIEDLVRVLDLNLTDYRIYSMITKLESTGKEYTQNQLHLNTEATRRMVATMYATSREGICYSKKRDQALVSQALS